MPQISVNSTSIYYEISGKGHPLVFIHAGGMDSGFWNAQVTYFSEKYQVITYDIRGHGRSSIPQSNFTVGDCVDDLQFLLGSLDIQQAYLSGISMGGYIALSYTLRCPEKVSALILTASNSGPLTDTVVQMAEEMTRRMKKIQVSTNTPHYMRAYDANIGRPDLTRRLSEIRQPVLLIVGERDMAAPVHISEMMHRRLANSQLNILSGCGHLCNQEQPDKFNTIVSDFLQKVEVI